ncbi:MAG: DUF4136 domain-containing protein [Spongiibacteraceae bacterium]|nr:DUF4136 domain-containing protein [Spongiibacteraceae bacterium]
MRLLFLLMPLALIVGCQSTDVSIDYDTQASFAKYQYYELQIAPTKIEPENQTEAQAEKELGPKTNPLVVARVKKAVSTQLRLNGFMPASAKDPADVLIHYSVTSEVRTQASGSGASIGVGSSGRSTGVGLSFSFPLGKDTIKKDTTVLVDLLDVKDNRLKWRGSKTLVFSDETPEEISASIEEAVAEIFSFYPPGA